MSERLKAAQDRLNAALLAGEDTEPHRTAIEALQAKEKTEASRKRDEEKMRAADAAESIAARTEALTKETRIRLDSIVNRFPIPEKVNESF